jgi:hypothetical protein
MLSESEMNKIIEEAERGELKVGKRVTDESYIRKLRLSAKLNLEKLEKQKQ